MSAAIDPQQLLRFLCIIETGSLTRAAEALHITQPALTRALSDLEKRIGGRVLDRGRHGARATPLGDALAVHARSVRASMLRAQQDIDGFRRGTRGTLLVGTTPLFATDFLPKAVTSFLQERPEVKVIIVESAGTQLMQRLALGGIDMFVGPTQAIALPLGVESTPLCDDLLVVVCSPKHPLAQRRKVSMPDLQRHQWILSAAGSQVRSQIDSILLSANLTIDVAVETDSGGGLIGMLIRNPFLSMLPFGSIRWMIENRRLTRLPVSLPGHRRSLSVFHRPREEMPALALTFLGTLAQSSARPRGH